MDNFKGGDAQDKVKEGNKDDAANQASKKLLADAKPQVAVAGENVVQLNANAGVAQVTNRFNPSAYSVIPPYVLQELSRLEPHNKS
ncbi:MAG: hypothetical protein K2X81_23305, partial [Candidatus Obscuribacterales bacterium]|nr:hypothetical protein [Candidatus Obscuribacterales bacterium]